MATRFDYYITGADGRINANATSDWIGQTFTASANYTITSVILTLYKSGYYGEPGILTVSIKNTDENGLPTGEDLCSGTTNGNTLTEDTSGEEREISFGGGYLLSNGTKYAIVLRAAEASSYDIINWKMDSTSPTYSGGAEQYSTDSGDNWTENTDYDLIFETWGDAAAGTNTQINIGDAWKEVSAIKINIGDTWKEVAGMQINIGDTWKTIF